MKYFKLLFLLILLSTTVLHAGNLPVDSSAIKVQKFNRNIYDSLSKRLDYSKDRLIENKYKKTSKPVQLLADDTI